ncbi:LOW QUALITY PROTEIN: N-chimaerin-like [Haliotis rubra]|uniref:LOW QUALITY PROTEIN: N-chimaerin-like n=1 Tax=Haliotis rubra TaxID=36100 RepID=UPI001EE5DFD0|nr:LOW QUALITY PROTEIN: N-chimaerin-like [Haliotis rubra]
MHDGEESQPLPTWKTYLYTLQQEAPKPRRIICQKEVPNRPTFYGKEFHGNVSRDEADRLLSDGDGCYLVRKSERAPDAFTLAIRFNGETKNFKLYYDGKHFVGEKRFDTVHSLVEDGLIHFYIELRAADYISALSNESNYEESPYLAYSYKKKRLKTRSRPASSRRLDYTDDEVTSSDVDVPDTVVEEAEGDEGDEDDDDLPPDWKHYEKQHCFKLQNFMGLHWCDFCANFMWGLIAGLNGVKCQDCGFEAHKKCSEKVPNDCMPDMKYVKRIYGADLTTVVLAQKTGIPHVVEKCVKEIETRGLESEGLYRIAGFHDDVEAIRMSFDKDGENADISVSRYDDINTVTSALKLFFRLLPIPLITFDVYKTVIEAAKKEESDVNEQVKMLKEAMASLPAAHFQTLKYLIMHLVRVTDHKSKNMMGAENLSIVFAPTLMRPLETDPMVSLMAAKFEQKVIELIIVHHKEVFGK